MKFALALTSVLTLALSSTSVLGVNHFSGLTVSNSIGNDDGYTCRTQDQWNDVARDARGLGLTAFRILAFDCNALIMASNAAAQYNIQVLAGIYIPGSMADSDADINTQVQQFISAVGTYGADRYVGLTIGNEVEDDARNIMAKVYAVRGYINSIGITVPISTVHTWVFIRDNPIMCGADFTGANAHAFFDGSPASNAQNFLTNTVLPALTAACPGKTIRITETGWPSRGDNFNAATPSIQDALVALQGLNCAAQNAPTYIFEYDDQLWKDNDNERSFGAWVKIQGFADSC